MYSLLHNFMAIYSLIAPPLKHVLITNTCVVNFTTDQHLKSYFL